MVRKRGYRDSITHYTYSEGDVLESAFPNLNDLKKANIWRGRMKTLAIKQMNAETGKVEGYTFLHDRVGEQTPDKSEDSNKKIERQLEALERDSVMFTGREYNEELKKIVKQNGWDIRFHPAKGYYLNESGGSYEKKPEARRMRAPIEVMKSMGHPEIEHYYLKSPTGELIPATQFSGKTWVNRDAGIARRFFGNRRGKKSFTMHEHPRPRGDKSHKYGVQSPDDVKNLISERDRFMSSIVAQRDAETGELQGYTFLHVKPGKYEVSKESGLVALDELDRVRPNLEVREYFEKLNKIVRENKLDFRFHPARGYYFDKETGIYEKKPSHSLEGAVAPILIGFAILFLLVRVPLTGNVIANSVLNNFQGGLFLGAGTLFSLISYFILRIAGRKGLK